MIDKLLQIGFKLTGKRWFSDRISDRRVERRWREAAATHVAKGGVVATYKSTDGETSFLI